MAGNEYRGVAPGTFRGLDLREDFYVGGVPDYSSISTASGYRQVRHYIFLACAIKLILNTSQTEILKFHNALSFLRLITVDNTHFSNRKVCSHLTDFSPSFAPFNGPY